MRTIILSIALATSGVAVASDDARVFEGSLSGKDLKTLRLDARVAEVEIAGHGEDQVTWRVTLTPTRDGIFSSLKDARESIAKAELEQGASAGRLSLAIDYPRGTDHDEILERWEIRVPARFAADVDMAVGQLGIRGVSGGVSADLAVGEVDIEVPAGRVDAEVNVGEIIIESATKDLGDVELEANVGDVSLRLDGARISADRGFGPGADIDVRRDGKDHIEASVNVGDVRVTVR